jgi:ribonuclease HI
MPTQCNILFISSVKFWVPRRKNILNFRYAL